MAAYGFYHDGAPRVTTSGLYDVMYLETFESSTDTLPAHHTESQTTASTQTPLGSWAHRACNLLRAPFMPFHQRKRNQQFQDVMEPCSVFNSEWTPVRHGCAGDPFAGERMMQQQVYPHQERTSSTPDYFEASTKMQQEVAPSTVPLTHQPQYPPGYGQPMPSSYFEPIVHNASRIMQQQIDPFSGSHIHQAQPSQSSDPSSQDSFFEPKPIMQKQQQKHSSRKESKDRLKAKRTKMLSQEENDVPPEARSNEGAESWSSVRSSSTNTAKSTAPLDCYVFTPANMEKFGTSPTALENAVDDRRPYQYAPVYMELQQESTPFEPQVIVQGYGVPVTNASKPLAPKRVRDWNEEFQRVRMIPQQHRAEPLYLLTKDFVSTATTIGKKIIMEAHLPEWLKTIQPKDAGGVAGGQKFMEEGIFFKFANDEHGLYGGHEFAAKACNHELRGLNALLNCWIDGLHFPMLCLIDFLGYRLVACSILPIKSSTLIYGSADAGLTVKNSSPEFSEKVEMAAAILNLKGHLVGRSPAAEKQMLHLAGDVEGHCGLDGRFYLLDTARVFPPDVPKPSIRCGHLYRMLRPELVKQNPVPLSSDAFSRWGEHNAPVHNREVMLAAKQLTSQIIPSFAAHLRGAVTQQISSLPRHLSLFDFWQGNIGVQLDGELLTLQMHRRGINMRYLGSLYTAVGTDCSQTSSLIITEMVARVAKGVLRASLRKSTEDTSDVQIRNSIVAHFNSLFFGLAVWSDICARVCSKFDLALDLNSMLRKLDRTALFLRLQKMSGARFEPNAMDKLVNPTQSFIAADIKDVEPTVKSMRFVSMYEGFALLSKAEDAAAVDPDTQRLYYLQAIEKFKDCLSAMPDEPNAVMNWGYAFMRLAQLEKRPDVAPILFDAAVAKLEEALGMNYSFNVSIYTQSQALYNMGLCLYHHAAFLRLQMAEQDFDSQSLQAKNDSLLAKAVSKFEELRDTDRMQHVKGNVPYLLACLYALLNKVDDCKMSLETLHQTEQLTRHMLDRDDFASVRSQHWFQVIESSLQS